MMTTEQSRRWVGLIGLATGMAILVLMCLAVALLYGNVHVYQETPFNWPETVMRLFFGNSR
jgi:hypothetical protein